MTTNTLFLAWQDQENSHQWYPVGRLDADCSNSNYRFRYTGGAMRAEQEAEFRPLLDFPSMDHDYRATELFPVFQNRLVASTRPDFSEYLSNLALGNNADPIEILSVNGGRRVTDTYEVFPKLIKESDGRFLCRFFLHGWRHVSECAQQRLNSLKRRGRIIRCFGTGQPTNRAGGPDSDNRLPDDWMGTTISG